MNYEDIDADILASLGKHFQSAFDGYLPIFFENQHIDQVPDTDYIEIRIDGPDIDEIANSQYVILVDVDLKIVRQKTNNLMTIRRDAGKCAESLRQAIPFIHSGDIPAPENLYEYVDVTTGQLTAAYSYVDDPTGDTNSDSLATYTTVSKKIVRGLPYGDQLVPIAYSDVADAPLDVQFVAKLGCLSTQGVGGRRYKIEVQHYGQLDPLKDLLVATVSTTLSIFI